MPSDKLDPAAGGSYPCRLPLDPGSALVITGSLASNPADRSLRREQIWPVQVILDGRAHAARYFQPVGEFGASSFAFIDSGDPAAPVYFSPGSQLCRLDFEHRTIVPCGASALVDVHEISHEENRILIANTGRDEVMSYWPEGGSVSRLSLDPFRGNGTTIRDEDRPVDRFHVNQAFRGLDGDLWALVHHFEGRQLLRRVLGGVIKSQGDGGLLNLDKKLAINLSLAAPHSVRIVGDEYWLMNSGRNEIVAYSPTWQRRRTVASVGWGRGLAFCGELAYAGISPLRKRYRTIFDSAPLQAMIQVLRIPSGESLGSSAVLNVEQINNVYCVARSVAEMLLSV